MATSYGNLVPEWLMADIQQLLQYTPEGQTSMEEFEDQYETGHVDPYGGGRTRYYYDFDFGEDYKPKFHGKNVRGETQGRLMSNTIGNPEGYKFHSREDAYEAYVASQEGKDLGRVEGINIFDEKSLVEGIKKARGIRGDDYVEGMYTAFTPEMFRGLHTGAYQEDIEEGRGSLLDNLMARTKKAQSLGGGLAGYGQRGAQKGVAQQSYLGGMGDVYAGVDEQKSAALQSIYDVLGQYETIQGA